MGVQFWQKSLASAKLRNWREIAVHITDSWWPCLSTREHVIYMYALLSVERAFASCPVLPGTDRPAGQPVGVPLPSVTATAGNGRI